MEDIVDITGPTKLADFESLDTDKDASGHKVLIHTIRDYMPFFDQGVVVAANDGTRDKGQIITGYPEGEVRGYNEGWDSAVATGKAASYESAMIRTRSVVDVDLYKKKGDQAPEWRLRRDQAFMRGLARQAVRKVFYGDRGADGRDVQGLSSIVVPTNEAFANRIIDAKGTTEGKETDIWLINWSTEGMYMFYPQNGAAAGLQQEDMGEQYVSDRNGKRYRGLVTEFGWDLGVALYDPEKIVRITNIDTTKLSKSSKTSGTPDLVDLLTQAAEMLPDDSSGSIAFYMNDTLRSVLRRQMQNRDNASLTWDEVAGRKVLMYGDIPIHKLGSDVLFNDRPVLAA
ncbi:MAG: hypothetical protein SOT69_10825 [Mesosutterella sp.]|nr:hypothetical protein [Mesosutterella sp.]